MCRSSNSAIRYAHGSKQRVAQGLEWLGYRLPNTSAIERRNGTARRMNAHQVCKSLTFSRRAETKLALGWWGVMVYNWCRPHRSLRQRLAQPMGKKASATLACYGARIGYSALFNQGHLAHSHLYSAAVR
jgi:hypothetical protein